MDDMPHGSETPEDTPASAWDRDAAKRALDDLFSIAGRYRATKAYKELVDFVARFRFYSPFNALLIHLQKPGVVFVAPAHRWRDEYKREIVPGARPIVILRPMGPVMFVFDVSQTEPTEDAPELPSEVTDPFPASGAAIGPGLPRAIENGKRDGVRVRSVSLGSQGAGSIKVFPRDGISQKFQDGLDRLRRPTYVEVPVRYDLLVNSKHSPEAQYATLTHELAHLYCGHLGSPNPKWWPNRRGLKEEEREFEAESISYMVCTRLGIKTSSAGYLASYIEKKAEVPSISLELVMKTAGLIESMTERSLPRRDESSQGDR